MGEIGNVLGEARRRRELDLLQCEQATKIRSKYLMAMEEDRFEILPEPVFVRGMLRTYATYLGVDPVPLVERYEREVESSAPPPHPPAGGAFVARRRPTRRGRRRGLDPRLVLFGVGAAIVVAVLFWLGQRGPENLPPAPVLTDASPGGPVVVTAPVVTGRRPAAPAPVDLVIMGTSGTPADVQVRRDDAEGQVIARARLTTGQRRRVRVARRVWVRVAPGGGTVAARLDGRAVALPPGDAGVVLTPAGVVR
ncbi:MAG: helix-turn-helix domain-containing protein [Thermoleophilia bacterium]|nr:helix-turn-helix domain-containing protein [Thermoleophilia bacterium]